MLVQCAIIYAGPYAGRLQIGVICYILLLFPWVAGRWRSGSGRITRGEMGRAGWDLPGLSHCVVWNGCRPPCRSARVAVAPRSRHQPYKAVRNPMCVRSLGQLPRPPNIGTVQPCVYWAKFAVVVGPKPYGGAARAAASVTDAVLCYVCCDVDCIELRGMFWGLFPVRSP